MSFADKFNLLNEFNILRLICGLFLIPHIYGKFYEPAALGFFVAAKFKPPKFWMYLAGAVEVVLAIGLIFGIFTTIAAAVAAIHLAIAAAGVYRVTGKWLWNIGGFEYCLFWAIACAVVAMHGYRTGGLWY
jgi:putative oxidoreductase